MSVSAHSPDGSLWFLFAADETPTLTPVKHPAPGLIIDTVYEAPVLLHRNLLFARQFTVTDAGVFAITQERPINEGRMEYVEFLTPAGVSWVFGITDVGGVAASYLQLFTSGSPSQRRLTTTVMHKGTLLWVADNRMPVPRRGG